MFIYRLPKYLLLINSCYLITMQALYQSNAAKSFPKIIGIGKNYLKHVKEMGMEAIPEVPVVFTKPWTAVTYMPKEVHLPISGNHRVDH